ncbi:alpha/beta-hydrolase [Hortaea werneckii]|nr:alpha/beta-hydrolase [Hortaea werneckii]KAI6985653.1 alpha/beta-hydrolase [Hortaea werneckii]KAI7140134.1 alpha/beta-hydrolase [Hortaea werneckii]KAI7166961.1 alpha/beta-hydrolase [Hortaea werneckii]
MSPLRHYVRVITLLLACGAQAYARLNTTDSELVVPDPSCRCGSSAFLTLPHSNLSQPEPANKCFAYRVLDARGTAEPQGVSTMFSNLVARVLANQTEGLSQPVEYPAGPAQNTTSGQAYLLDAINSGLKACPDQKYVVLGYSQGASLVLEASKNFKTEALKAIKAIILVGNPYRFPGKKSNVDSHAQPDIRGTIGLFTTNALSSGSPIPQISASLDESGKVLDYCLENDIVCSSNPACDCQIPADHLSYGLTQTVQDTAFEHIIQALA